MYDCFTVNVFFFSKESLLRLIFYYLQIGDLEAKKYNPFNLFKLFAALKWTKSGHVTRRNGNLATCKAILTYTAKNATDLWQVVNFLPGCCNLSTTRKKLVNFIKLQQACLKQV